MYIKANGINMHYKKTGRAVPENAAAIAAIRAAGRAS